MAAVESAFDRLMAKAKRQRLDAEAEERSWRHHKAARPEPQYHEKDVDRKRAATGGDVAPQGSKRCYVTAGRRALCRLELQNAEERLKEPKWQSQGLVVVNKKVRTCAAAGASPGLTVAATGALRAM